MKTDVIKSTGKIVREEVPIHGFKAAVGAVLLSGSLWCSGAGAADAAGWRTDGTGRYPDAKPCVAWSPTSNVIWRTQMPGPGNAMPAIAGDRLFVCAEPSTLLCINKADGAILWQRTNSYEQVMTPEESAKAAKDKTDSDELRKKLGPIEKDLQKAKNDLKKTPEDEEIKKKIGELQPQVEDLKKQLKPYDESPYRLPATQDVNGYSSPTPVTDGKSVYVVFGSGVAACYDLAGVRKWIRLIEKPSNGWGHSASPLLVGGKLLVHILHLWALGPDKGDTLWKTRVPERWGTSVATRIGDVDVIITPSGHIVRVSDGVVLAKDLSTLDYCAPIVQDGVACFIQAGGKALKLPTGVESNAVKPQVLWTTNPQKERYYASPVFHEGLIYAIMQKGVFSVIDAADGKVAYERKLELGGTIYPSICMAGNLIFASGDSGVTMVMQSGREPAVMATNRLEGFRSTPVFEADRMYIRGMKNLYCIGAPAAGK